MKDHIRKHPLVPRFNRYMVECEFKSRGTVISMEPVLIDTWWNVNI